jgi:hypothetical protein
MSCSCSCASCFCPGPALASLVHAPATSVPAPPASGPLQLLLASAHAPASFVPAPAILASAPAHRDAILELLDPRFLLLLLLLFLLLLLLLFQSSSELEAC